MMLRNLFIFLLTFLIPAFSLAQRDSMIKGTVFLDNNHNGALDISEIGIGGVGVSNGCDVVWSDASGRWTLPKGENGSVFVIKPANYSVPVDSEMLPRYFFLFPANPGTDTSLARSLDFPMVSCAENKKFTALFFGDTQARGVKEVNYINHDVVEELIGTEAAFGVSLGDITADGPELFGHVSRGIAQIGIPWYNTFGNHDNDRDAKTMEEKSISFTRKFGPATYAFEYGEVVFIDLNDIFFQSDGKYISHFTESQLAFVKNYLSRVPTHKLLVLMMHSPIVSCDNKDKLYELLKERKYTFSISGHVHDQMNIFVTHSMGWQGTGDHHHLVNATVCGSWWCGALDELGIPHATMNDGAPNGYSAITFDGNRYSVRFKAARRPENYQMNIYLPEEIRSDKMDSIEVLVNIFAGSERSAVEMSIDNSNRWIPLKHTLTADPEVARMHRLSPFLQQKMDGQLLEDIFGNAMDRPSKSRHMWQSNLPGSGITAGTHRLTVRTTDMYGQTWTAHRIFNVISE